ncbi:MAG: family F420-dependent class oxidoreductase [Gammaproteobacteria bacterium]|jgi:coenzyme F420-dependent glucose-6-phosphate dehydrogenase|nr:family F420-dependent class oxidoreductase [Gammaproteobacteria bacterium]
MLQLGWKAGTEQYPPAELAEYAVAAEKAGFDSIDASDHFHPWSEQGQACFVWSWLGVVAARTGKIALGTGITCPIIRYHPAVIAQAAATMACLAPGRFYLGLGTGEALNEYASTARWPGYNGRREQLAEAIELIRALWTGEKTTHEGVHYQTRQAKLYTRPQESIPIYISSLVPDSAHFAGKHGDGLITVGGDEPDTYRQIIENFEAGAREAGKDPARMPRMIEIGVAYTQDEQKAIELRKAYWAGTFVPALFTERIYTPKMSEDNGKIVGADAVKQSVCISADPEEHVKLAEKYITLGFDHLIFHSAGPDQKAFIEGYGRDVLPRLRNSPQLKAATTKRRGH